MKKVKFLDQVSNSEKFIAEGFIIQVYSVISYYCKKCRKFSDRMCECGNFPDPIFRINGAFSDGTRTLSFITKTEAASEKLSGLRKDEVDKLDYKKIMKKPYRIEGCIKNKKLIIDKIVE